MEMQRIEQPTVQTNDRSRISAQDVLTGNESLGILRSQVESQPNTAAAHLPGLDLIDFKDRANHLIDRGDGDHDGALSNKEVLKMMQDTDIKGPDADVLATMYRVSSKRIEHIVVNGEKFDAPDITSHDNINKLTNDRSGQAYVNFANEVGDRRQQPTSRELYSDHDNPLNSIRKEAIHQGMSGDCYLESNLADAADKKPELIRDAIKENKDGSYTVTFKGDVEHPVTITALTDAELGLFNGGSPTGLWAPVMEKAYAQHEVQFGDRGKNPDDVIAVPQDAVAAGDPEGVSILLSGKGAATWRMEEFNKPGQTTYAEDHVHRITYDQAFAKKIQDAMELDGLVTAGFQDTDEARAAGFTDMHSYSVLGYEPGPDGGTITLRNPWGIREDGSQSEEKAEQKISMQQFMKIGESLVAEY